MASLDEGTMSTPVRASLLVRLIVAVVLLLNAPLQAQGEERGRDCEADGEHELHRCGDGVHEFRDPEFHGLRLLDSRHEHDRYYPVPGQVLDALPGYARIHGPSGDLLFADGVWYREVWPYHYAVVTPAPGATIPVLPRNYTTVMIGGAPYFYANNTYYVRSPQGYTVTPPPPERAVVPR
jgi:hypothetical protein